MEQIQLDLDYKTGGVQGIAELLPTAEARTC